MSSFVVTAKSLKKGRKALKRAAAKAILAAKGKKPMLSSECASALKDAAGRVAACL